MRAFGSAALRNPRSLWRLALPALVAVAIALGAFVAYSGESNTRTVRAGSAANTSCIDFQLLGPAAEFPNQNQDIIDATVSDGNITVQYSITDGFEKLEWELISATGTAGLDLVIVKGGPQGSNEYHYDPEETSDSDLTTPGSHQISNVDFCYDLDPVVPLGVTKTANATFDRTHSWTISKTVDPDEWRLFDGDSGASEYNVSVTEGTPTDSNYQVTGTITITNPNSVPVEITDITDTIDLGGEDIDVEVTCPVNLPITLDAAGGDDDQVICDYSADESDGLDGDEDSNDVVVETSDPDAGSEDNVSFDYVANDINGDVTVTDTNDEFGGPYENITESKDFDPYSITFTCDDLTSDQYVDGVATYTHENTAQVTGDNNQVLDEETVTVTVHCYRLDIDKMVETSFDREYLWKVEKSVTPETISLVNGQSDDADYTVTLTELGFEDGNYSVSGEITISNPNPDREAIITDLVDSLSSVDAATVVCPDPEADDEYVVPAASGSTTGELVCTYEIDLGEDFDPEDNDNLTNTATATQRNFDGSVDDQGAVVWSEDGDTDYSTDAKAVDFGDTPANEINKSVSVEDVFEGGAPDSYGPFVATGVVDNTFDVPVPDRTFSCPDDEGDHTNVVSIVDDNGDEVEDQDGTDNNSATVTVTCREPDPLGVTKTVEASFTRTWNWEVEKSADPAELHLFDGDSGEIEYGVEAIRTGSTDSNFLITGTITIVNQNEVPVTIDSVVDLITPGNIAADVTCDEDLPHILASSGNVGDTLECSYTADGADGLDGDEVLNTVTVTTEGDAADGSDTADISYTMTEINETVSVDDTHSEFGGPYAITNSTSFDPYTVAFTCDDLTDQDYVDGVASYTHDNTASVTGEQGEIDSDTETITVFCYRLDVSKTVDTGFDRRFEWTIDKSADPATHNLLVGGSDTSEYTIEVTKSEPIDENFAVSGTITIENPHPSRAATLTAVTDIVSPGLAASVVCPSMTVPAGGSLECSYSLDLANGDARENTATATLQNFDIDAEANLTTSGTTDFSSGAVPVSFGAPDTVTLDSISVVDSYGPAPDPWNFSDDGSVNYTREFTCSADDLNGQTSVTLQFPNTATIEQTNQSDDALVVVNCAEQDTLIVSKTVDLSFDRTWDWEIEKSASPTVHNLTNDEEGTSNYTIEVTKSGPIDSNWQISGVISITNPATITAVITGVADVVSQTGLGNTDATITGCTIDGANAGIPSAGSPVNLDPDDTMLCNYAADLPGGNDGSNVATVSTSGDVPGASGVEDVDFATASFDETLAEIEVTDSYDGAPDPWTFDSSDAVGYSRDFTCENVDFGADNFASFTVENTATITETGENDDADVTVNCTLDEEPGTIIIRKQADPDGSPWVFQFDGPGDLSGGLLSGQTNVETLEPGTYVVSEDLDELVGDTSGQVAWDLVDITCESDSGESTFDEDLDAGSVEIDLAAGDTVDCTFFNEQNPPVVIPEAPFAILFPIIGLLVAAGGYLFWRRRERLGRAG